MHLHFFFFSGHSELKAGVLYSRLVGFLGGSVLEYINKIMNKQRHDSHCPHFTGTYGGHDSNVTGPFFCLNSGSDNSLIRAQNNSLSMDNVWLEQQLDRPKTSIAGHVDQSRSLSFLNKELIPEHLQILHFCLLVKIQSLSQIESNKRIC